MSRVTKLGEFWPIVSLLILGSFLMDKVAMFNSDKNGLGYSLGYFFTNSSGHPGHLGQGCQIFIRTTYQNGKKYMYQKPSDKMYQVALQ
jgi:hypothetical protein